MDTHLISLDAEHPGFRDPDYRKRRDAIARQALEHRPGTPAPRVAYTAEEEAVWATVLAALAPLHARWAARSYREAFGRVGFTPGAIPQLAEVSARLGPVTRFAYAPVAGLMTPRDFMAQRTFLGTQYMRHPSAPLYTPEPDVIHELVGHAPSLLDERYARLNELFGEATLRASDEEVERLIRTYWYTLEFGLVREDGAVKALGAGLLSSFGELGRFAAEASLRPFDLPTLWATPFDPTQYQSTLFVATSEEALVAELSAWLEGVGR